MYYKADYPVPAVEFRLELGSRFHVFSNGRWWTPDLAEARRAVREYPRLAPVIEEWRNGEFYRKIPIEVPKRNPRKEVA